MKKRLSKQDVLFKMKTEATAFMASSRTVKLISLIVLDEVFGFTNEELKEYIERFEDVLDYYNKSDNYKELLEEWDEHYGREIGQSILWKP